jgi:hypothetical protein
LWAIPYIGSSFISFQAFKSSCISLKKARHDGTQFYQKRKDMPRREMPRGVMTISGDPDSNNSSSSLDDDVEDDTYMPSPWAHPHGKGLASASGSGAARDEEEIEEEEDGGNENDGAEGDGDEEDKEVFNVMRSTPLLTYTWGLQFFGYPSTRIGGRKSATRAKQIW